MDSQLLVDYYYYHLLLNQFKIDVQVEDLLRIEKLISWNQEITKLEEFIKRSIHAVDEEHERDTKVVAEELLGVLEQARDDHFRIAWNAEARRSYKVAPGLQGRELTIHH